MDEPESFVPGEVIAERYRLDEQIGLGGMAKVYRALDLDTGLGCAVKLLRADIADNEEAVERIRREGELLSNLEHPSIVQVLDFGPVGDGRLYLAMELLDGETLGDRIRRGHLYQPQELSQVLEGTVAALSAAHRAGVVHRDLKPDNIFLCAGQHDGVKLLDFGISKVFGGKRLTHTGQVLGTPRYMAPEQLSADRDLDERVDVYALGVIAYEALSGVPPFPARNPSDLIVSIIHGQSAPLRSHRKDLHPDVEAVVARAMASSRTARFETARSFWEAWRSVVEMHPGSSQEGRGQMSTRGMGVMGARQGPVHGSSASLLELDDGSELRPGTFGARLSAGIDVFEDAARQAEAGFANARSDNAAASPESPALVERDSVSDPSSDVSPMASLSDAHRAALGTSQSAVSVPAVASRSQDVLLGDAGGLMSPEESSYVPKAASSRSASVLRVVAVIVALAAGAGAAAGAIAALHRFGVLSGRTDKPTTGAEVERDGDDEVDPEVDSEPNDRGQSAAQDENDDEELPLTESPPSGFDGDPESDLRGVWRQARESRRAGNPEVCVQVMRQALDDGAPPIALKLYGDCLREAGREQEARAAYDRLCTLLPDHPRVRRHCERE